MADANGDICQLEIANFCRAHSLHKAVMSAHPHLPLLTTFLCGSLQGTKPIDGIWVSQDLPVAFSSWCSFAMSPGDHQAGVIDLDLAALIGKPCQKIIQPKAHRLTCAIPSSWDSYNQLFLQSSQCHLLLPKLHALFWSPPSQPLIGTLLACTSRPWIPSSPNA